MKPVFGRFETRLKFIKFGLWFFIWRLKIFKYCLVKASEDEISSDPLYLKGHDRKTFKNHVITLFLTWFLSIKKRQYLPHYWSEKGLKVATVNRACPSANGGSLDIESMYTIRGVDLSNCTMSLGIGRDLDIQVLPCWNWVLWVLNSA